MRFGIYKPVAMIYRTTINSGIEACVMMLREAEHGSFLALVVDQYNTSTYAIGQLDHEDGYYQMQYLREECLYDIFTGDVDWTSSEVWTSGNYTYSDMESGYMTKDDT